MDAALHEYCSRECQVAIDDMKEDLRTLKLADGGIKDKYK